MFRFPACSASKIVLQTEFSCSLGLTGSDYSCQNTFMASWFVCHVFHILGLGIFRFPPRCKIPYSVVRNAWLLLLFDQTNTKITKILYKHKLLLHWCSLLIQGPWDLSGESVNEWIKNLYFTTVNHMTVLPYFL